MAPPRARVGNRGQSEIALRVERCNGPMVYQGKHYKYLEKTKIILREKIRKYLGKLNYMI